MQKSIIATAGIVTALTACAMPAQAAGSPKPALSLVSATSAVTLYREPGYGVDLNLGRYLVATKLPFEIRVTRNSFRDPVRAAQVVEWNGVRWYRPLPAKPISGFDDMRKFLHIVVTDAHGKAVIRKDATFCPNTYDSARTRPDAPGTSPYPQDCAANPFTLGAVWGILAGWSANPFSLSDEDDPVQLADGKYTATVTVNPRYRRAFDIARRRAYQHGRTVPGRLESPVRQRDHGRICVPLPSGE